MPDAQGVVDVGMGHRQVLYRVMPYLEDVKSLQVGSHRT